MLPQFFMKHADFEFAALTDTKLTIVDTASNVTGQSDFHGEADMLRFVGEYLLSDDGPTEEFARRYPMHA